VLYPLRFKEALRNYGFGDRWIVEAYEKEGLPEDHRVAETWEVCDRPTESSMTLEPSGDCALLKAYLPDLVQTASTTLASARGTLMKPQIDTDEHRQESAFICVHPCSSVVFRQPINGGYP
jgi:hypothetical protein